MILYSFRKEIDWSVFHQGISIPVDVQIMLKQFWPKSLDRGESMPILLEWDGHKFPAILKNQQFDVRKHPNHPSDIIQIRYSKESEIARTLRNRFASLYMQMQNLRDSIGPSKKRMMIPDQEKIHISIGITDTPSLWVFDLGYTYTPENFGWLEKVNEYDLETSESFDWTDSHASIQNKTGLIKLRQLDRTIGEKLKSHYEYCCQICGHDFGKPYDAHPVEAHHIEPFTTSLNNNGSNQIIICPNHHRVIHQTKAEFRRDKLAFFYPNGFAEPIVLNDHL